MPTMSRCRSPEGASEHRGDDCGDVDRNKQRFDLSSFHIEYFADKNGITPARVRDLIAKHGNDRETLERAVKAGLTKR